MSTKIVVLTGASHGLGRAMVPEFVQQGWTVAGCARSVKEIATLQREFGAPHQFVVVDVVEDGDVGAWAREVLRTVGVPDLLINNAGVINRNAPVWEVTAAEFGRVIDVNLKGPANVIRHFVPAMVGRKSGVVVNMSSGWGRSTAAEVAPYCASKWGIEGLTQALALELPAGMSAVSLNPGIINTRMLQSCFGEEADDYPRPEAWAGRAVPFLIGLGAESNGMALTAPG